MTQMPEADKKKPKKTKKKKKTQKKKTKTKKKQKKKKKKKKKKNNKTASPPGKKPPSQKIRQKAKLSARPFARDRKIQKRNTRGRENAKELEKKQKIPPAEEKSG